MKYRGNMKPKYNNRKLNGFDSRAEQRRYAELLVQEQVGLITDLQRQVEYLLIPSQYKTINGKRTCIERACKYKADFVYKENGMLVVEDVKGFKTPDYIIKRKLMLEKYDIIIKEVKA